MLPKPLNEKEYWQIYKRVPRLTVEVILKSSEGIFLTLRAIEPFKNVWHIPGGTVRFKEGIAEAVNRVARDEVGVEVLSQNFLGFIEYPTHWKNGYGHPVGLAFEVIYKGTPEINEDAYDGRWFKKLPPNLHAHQEDFILTYVLNGQKFKKSIK